MDQASAPGQVRGEEQLPPSENGPRELVRVEASEAFFFFFFN